ncbi:hypothetical protein M3591_12170 [Exiguobacterium sp. MER 193]|uniref:hypothetical protein n=1 Tax=unclassified Exiguobacterium TaxID=2644629 RepID=UPI001BED3991|nr:MULTISPECIES: hypothetical protein [unclassified Exiguobacterium]MCM3281269.1 hypothetical protein [Exiguobacterium sp. MER 193]
MDRAIHLPPTLGFAPRRLEEGEFSPTSVKIYTLIATIGLMTPLSIWIFLLLLANGISEA